MDDVFAKYGGQSLPEPEQEPAKDPFAAYGGQEVPQQPITTKEEADPFAQYGGESEYSKLKKETAAYGLGDLVTEQAAEARGSRLWSKTTSNKDIATIAEHNKVNPDDLRSIAPYLMAIPPSEEMSASDYAKLLAGAVGYGALGDVPQFLYKKMQEPNMRAAIDDLRELSEGRLGGVAFVASNLLPTPKISLAAKAVTASEKALSSLGKAAGVGAVYGLAGSREGEELTGAATGAAVGGAIAGALRGGKAVLDKVRGGDVTIKATGGPDKPHVVDEQAKLALQEYAEKNETKIAEVADEAWSRIEDSEKDIAGAVVKNEALTDDTVKRILDEQLSPDSVDLTKKQLADKLGREVSEITDREVVEQLLQQRKEAFADRLAKETPAYGEPVREGEGATAISRAPTSDEVLARASGAGEEALVGKFLGEAYIRTGLEQLDKLGVRSAPDAAPIGKLLVNSISDRQFVLKTIDEVKGSNLLPHFLDLMTNYNHLTAEKAANDTKIGTIFKIAKKDKLVRDLTETSGAGGRIFQAMDNNADDTLTGTEKAIAQQVRGMINAVRERANTMTGTGIKPLAIAERADFGLPNILKKPVDAVIAFKQQIAKADSELQQSLGRTLETVKSPKEFAQAMSESPAFRELYEGAQLFYKEPIRDGLMLQDALREATQRGASNPRLHGLATTTLRREDKIPDFLREKNVFQIMKRYSENTMRNVYLREPLDQLVNQARLLEGSKANVEAEYVRRLVADNLGIRAASMARLGNEVRIRFAEAVDKQISRFVTNPEKRKEIVDGLRLVPEMMANLQYNVYPNVLGLNPRAHMAQLTQTWFKNAPEIGGRYGYELTMKSFTEAVLALRSPRARELIYGKVKQYGLEPESFVREASEALAEEAERRVLYNTSAKALRTMSQAFMYTYGKMDTFNRAVTANMAERLAADLNAGSKSAFDSINKMPVSIKRQLVKNKGDVPAQARVLAQYLNSVTQYNYNRPAMSELGIIAGPFFSTFTKWPLATAGDIVADLRTKGLTAGGKRAAEKYAVTLLLASAIDNAIRYGIGGELDVGGDFKDYDERLRKTVGTGGFVGMAPIASATALLPGQKEKSLFVPPIVDAFYNGILSPMFSGDTEKLAKQGEKAAATFVPGAFVYRFLMEDIPIWVTGEKPD